MTRKRRVEEIFGTALELAPEDRPAFLERVCAGDHELRRDVEELLAAARASTLGLPESHQPVIPPASQLHPSLQGLSLAPNMSIGRYKLVELLGQGGMGTVFLAHDRRLHRHVAIKFLHAATREMTERFLAEARTTARCRHENIVVIHDVDELDGHPYMVLEYLEGEPLRHRLAGLVGLGDTVSVRRAAPLHGATKSAMPVIDVLELITPVIRALVCAHAQGIVHRDLKPENIFLCRNGTVKVLDFGIAKALTHMRGQHGATGAAAHAATIMPPERVATEQGALLGTLPYMSPEQWGADDIDVRTDIWAVGIMLHEMLAGRHPLAPLSYSKIQKQVPDLGLPMPAIGAAVTGLGELAHVVDGCLRKRKAERIQSSMALLDAIEEARAGVSASARAAALGHAPAERLARMDARDVHAGAGHAPMRDASRQTAMRSRRLALTGTAPRRRHRSEGSSPRVFVGRRDELDVLARVVARGPVPVCAVHGMPGVGKSYLVDRFADLHAADFPGGYERLVLEPGDTRTGDALRDVLRDRLKLTATAMGAWETLAERLRAPRTLVHVENVDSAELAMAVAELVRHLDGCPLVVTGRFRDLGRAAGWARIDMTPFDEGVALAQLAAELGAVQDAVTASARRTLVHELGGLPLALHLASGYLAAGQSVDGFLRKLRAKRLALDPRDPADPVLHQGKVRAILHSTFAISLDFLRDALARQGDARALMAGLAALGHAPAAGVGASLGAGIAGLSDVDYEDLVVEARALSVLEQVPARPGAVSMHPLLAELVRIDAPYEDVVARMTAWFVERLPEHEHEQGRRWSALHAEHAALVAWLAAVPLADCARVVRASEEYAWRCGPYLSWAGFCERSLLVFTDEEDRSHTLWMLGRVARQGGELDRALAAAEDKLRLDLARGAEREAAIARGQIADVLQARGDLDEALRIRREEELPVFERLGDARLRAVTLGKIADVLQTRGELDEALRIRREEELPVFERLGEVREKAVTLGKIADVLHDRGDLDQALRIRREELLPVFERLGDVRSRAVTLGKIADVVQDRGDLDQALRIRRDEELPVYERLGDVRSRAITLGKIADVLQARGDRDQALRIYREEVLPVFERLGDVRSRAMTMYQIAEVLEARHELDEALRILREEVLPVFERLGAVWARAVIMGRIAGVLQARGELEEALRICREEELPVYERLGARRHLVTARIRLARLYLHHSALGDREHAAALLRLALADAMAMKLVEANAIQDIMQEHHIEA